MNDEIPQHCEQAEWMLLACAIEQPEILSSLEAGTFYLNATKTVFNCIQALKRAGRDVNGVTVPHACREDVQAFDGVMQALSDLPSPAGWPYWLEICQDYEKARAIKALSADLENETGKVRIGQRMELADLNRRMREIESRGATSSASTKQIALQAHARIQAAFEDPESLNGVLTGFEGIDKRTRGLHPTNMVVIAARPGIGKTSLALNIAERIAVQDKIPMAFFSLEMDGGSLIQRMIHSMARVPLSDVLERKISERQIKAINLATARICEAPLRIFDKGSDLRDIHARASAAVQSDGVKVIVVDYLQRVQIAGNKEGRYAQVSEISRTLKDLALETQTCVIALAQLSREGTKENRRPILTDLRDSGQIEQDADVVALLHPKEGQHPDIIPTDLLIAKNRSGPTGNGQLIFRKSITRFENTTRDPDREMPTDI